MSSSIHANDYGTIFKLTIKDQDGAVVNLAAATEKKIILKPPQSAVVIKDASFDTDGEDGVIKYVTIDSDIAKAGTWQIQARIILPNIGRRYSQIQSFNVLDNL